MKKLDTMVVIILYYAGWFGSIFLAKSPFASLTLLFPIVLVTYFIFRKILNRKNFIFAFGTSLVGIAFDFLLIRLGLITTSGETILLFPIWLMSIWLLFSFSMLKIGTNLNPPIWLAALLGMVFGPLSYKSGEVFEVLTFANSITIFVYIIFWGAAFPIILNLSKRFV